MNYLICIMNVLKYNFYLRHTYENKLLQSTTYRIQDMWDKYEFSFTCGVRRTLSTVTSIVRHPCTYRYAVITCRVVTAMPPLIGYPRTHRYKYNGVCISTYRSIWAGEFPPVYRFPVSTRVHN